MTGEITLRGRVLPIGGLKEKIFAAHRGLIKTVLIPKDNAKDMKDIPEQISNNIEIVMVEHLDEVLKLALLPSHPEAFLEKTPGVDTFYQPEDQGAQQPVAQ
jgi:ATP-dependent Lon protease